MSEQEAEADRNRFAVELLQWMDDEGYYKEFPGEWYRWERGYQEFYLKEQILQIFIEWKNKQS